MAKKAKQTLKGKKKAQAKKPKAKKTAAPKKSQGKKGAVKPAKVFIYALALAALGGGGYLVYDRIKRKKLRISRYFFLRHCTIKLIFASYYF